MSLTLKHLTTFIESAGLAADSPIHIMIDGKEYDATFFAEFDLDNNDDRTKGKLVIHQRFSSELFVDGISLGSIDEI